MRVRTVEFKNGETRVPLTLQLRGANGSYNVRAATGRYLTTKEGRQIIASVFKGRDGGWSAQVGGACPYTGRTMRAALLAALEAAGLVERP